MLPVAERQGIQNGKNTDRQRKAQLGQFFTPESVADFMAGLFPPASGSCRLLDAGAGIGALSAAFLKRWRQGQFQFSAVDVDAYEIDRTLHPLLLKNLAIYRGDDLSVSVQREDFVLSAQTSLVDTLFSTARESYTHAILNPPYKKISSNSTHRLALRRLGIETVNLYSAFVALAVARTSAGGQIVAIIPRSFCNGPYYRPFRDYLLQHAAIRHIHLFASRSRTFQQDGVLQEHLIIRLERAGEIGAVTVSTSTDHDFTDLQTSRHPFTEIVLPDDPEQFIRIPAFAGETTFDLSPAICYTLDELGITVSTGPIVDFRLSEHLRAMPETNTVPLLYPGHFAGSRAQWPLPNTKKPNAIERNNVTEKWLYPNGYYCVVRRFSSKEEKRRIVASVVDPVTFGQTDVLGFENHLNLFHQNRQGLSEALAHGLAAFLNTTAVDKDFRRFNGHTQVNATDLRTMKYPSRDILDDLGQWAMQQEQLTQNSIDSKLKALYDRHPR